ncbi:TetR/AcrR family transcriptional regulator [Aquabacter sp. L1I39]|uniref:TetR/AcrR family transcriptional regulator n=1 Tax=Aquabacter sp. L1I39 TaxID=2820278 RepID=UPI001ADBB425|nr:TetR/AcrR family transcriptional regulator [Aquabacter sp. L1I39]QTL04725.1 TetR/AcrR family transcriptional regulator [Aquabacter sp. L1I39]
MSDLDPTLPPPTALEELRPKAREALLAARAVFLEEGYDGAKMDTIARVASLSKATLYAHFASKSDLFEALIRHECRAVNASLYRPDPGNPRMTDELRKVAANYRQIFIHKAGIELYRILVPVAPRFPRLARTFYAEGPSATIRQLADYLGVLRDTGRLRLPDADLAARQFLALVTEDIKLNGALGLPAASARQTEKIITSGIAMFVSVYAVAQQDERVTVD